MKPHNKVKRLKRKQDAYEHMFDDPSLSHLRITREAYHKPGSTRKS